jgi:hypothetical protein
MSAVSAVNESVLVAWEQEIRRDPTRVRVRFPAAAREVGRSPSDTPLGADRVEDGVRARLLLALADALTHDPDALSAEVHDLYRFGDADERRAVLLTLHRLPVDDRAADLLHDALRTNDLRLVAAALGPYGEVGLDAAAWRQGVLKCLFTGVPVDLVSGLADRTDDELIRMVTSYAEERVAAGRPVPEDARRILATRTRTRSREL